MKEVHFLCIQIEKMMKEDVILDIGTDGDKEFKKDLFKVPNEKEEQVL